MIQHSYTNQPILSRAYNISLFPIINQHALFHHHLKPIEFLLWFLKFIKPILIIYHIWIKND